MHHCDHCDYETGYKHNLTRHLKLKHKEEMSDGGFDEDENLTTADIDVDPDDIDKEREEHDDLIQEDAEEDNEGYEPVIWKEDPWQMLLRRLYNDGNVQLFEEKYAKAQRKKLADIDAIKMVWEKLCKEMLHQMKDHFLKIIEWQRAMRNDDIYRAIMDKYHDKRGIGESHAVAFDSAWKKYEDTVRRKVLDDNMMEILEGLKDYAAEQEDIGEDGEATAELTNTIKQLIHPTLQLR